MGTSRVLARMRPAGRLAWRPLEAVPGGERRIASVAVDMDAAGGSTAAWVAVLAPRAGGEAVVRTATRPALRGA